MAIVEAALPVVNIAVAEVTCPATPKPPPIVNAPVAVVDDAILLGIFTTPVFSLIANLVVHVIELYLVATPQVSIVLLVYNFVPYPTPDNPLLINSIPLIASGPFTTPGFNIICPE